MNNFGIKINSDLIGFETYKSGISYPRNDILQNLIKSSSFLITGDKATGVSGGVNAPFTNPWTDLVGKVGKNKLDYLTFINRADTIATPIANGLRITGKYYISFPFNSPAGQPLTLSATITVVSGTPVPRWTVLYTDDTAFSPNQIVGNSITPAKNVKRVYLYVGIGTDESADYTNIQLGLGTVATAYEPYGKANVLLQGFAGTVNDGWVSEIAPNGKTVIGLKADGVDSVGIMGSNVPNPTNNDFAFGFVIKTGANKIKYFAVMGDTSDATTQYGFKMDASGNLFVILNGTSIQIGTALTVGFHKIWLERVGISLKAEIDGVQTYSGTHSTTLTTRANTVLFASPTSGTTYTGFSNDTLFEYVYDNVDIPKGKIAFYKQVASQYGL